MKVYYATEAAYKRGYAKGYEEGLRSGLDLRPCLADGKPATFHRWVEEDKALLKIHAMVRPEDQLKIAQRFQEVGLIDSSSHIEKISATFALVEYADGSVGKVKPELIEFLDRKEG